MSDHNVRDDHFQTIPISLIEPDSDCVRKSDTDISGLKYTISDVGLLQPIIVRRTGDNYTVIDGHRRLRALKELDVGELIVGREVIVNADETEADNRFRQIIANIQREDIGDIELGHAFVMLKEVYGYQYNEIAEVIGKDRHYVSAKVGLATRLIPEVQKLAAYDMETAKTLRGDDVTEPYVMNVNILEAIARLPEYLQADIYARVKDREMDKSEAFRLIRSVKEADAGVNDGDELRADDRMSAGLYHYVKKVNKDVDMLAVKLKKDDLMEKEKILPAIESLIEKLNSLRSEIQEDRQISGKGKYDVILPEMV